MRALVFRYDLYELEKYQFDNDFLEWLSNIKYTNLASQVRIWESVFDIKYENLSSSVDKTNSVFTDSISRNNF